MQNVCASSETDDGEFVEEATEGNDDAVETHILA